ncbi:hypothetical protein QVD99_000499 [Batrachochytrium dendrobatidis]|nr:hypothetical protein QVD99_000499 [Batrachochytrium dendrobatidis]
MYAMTGWTKYAQQCPSAIIKNTLFAIRRNSTNSIKPTKRTPTYNINSRPLKRSTPGTTHVKPIWSPPSFESDILIYRSNNNKLLRFAYLAAGIQMFMWLNIAELAWTYMTDTETDEQGVETHERSSTLKRVAASGICGLSSLVFPGLVHYFATRKAKTVTILKGGKLVAIQNAARIGNKINVFKRLDLSSSARIVPILNAMQNTHASGLANQIYLKPHSKRSGYILEKDGEFVDPYLYDYLFSK